MTTSLLKKTIILFLGFLLLALFSNCNKQPEACILVDKETVAIGESISLSSCSENAEKAIWSFGDGSADVEADATTKAYSEAGTYLVELRTFSKRDKKWDRSSKLIKVEGPKKRYLKRIMIEAFPNLKPDLSTWDNALLGPDPDIFVLLNINNSNYSFKTSVYSEAKLNQLPLIWEYAPLRILLTNSPWKIEMRDDDQVLGVGGSELMAEFEANLSSVATTSAGVISFVQQNVTIKIEFSEE